MQSQYPFADYHQIATYPQLSTLELSSPPSEYFYQSLDPQCMSNPSPAVSHQDQLAAFASTLGLAPVFNPHNTSSVQLSPNPSFIHQSGCPLSINNPPSPQRMVSSPEPSSSHGEPSSPSYTQTVDHVARSIKRKNSALSSDIAPYSVEDPAAKKRHQNTMAARRSRQRKVQKMEELEGQVNDLKKENIQLETKIAILETEKTNSRSKEIELQLRLKSLEDQLNQALSALSKSQQK
jgi:hypothetical protein